MTEEAIKYLVDEEVEQENWVIDSDEKATWAIEKIALERAESQRYINTCESMIMAYQQKMKQEAERLKTKTSYLECQLQDYFKRVDKQQTKTQEIYRLPTGTLRLKTNKKIEKDDDALKDFLKATDSSYVTQVTSDKVDWKEFKKTLTFEDGHAITEDGEVLEFISETEEKQFVIDI